MSQAGSITEASTDMRPIASSERIQALDVVRGFALIGIFLMNIEWFNRPIAELPNGLPAGVHGVDWLAGYLIYILVQGKFWTMFSLLFGMGFAVMLTRAERAGRNFLVPYARRIAALAAFGALHHIFLWAGDILFSYAVAALCLLLLLWAPWMALVMLPVACFFAAALIPGAGWAGEIGFGLTLVLLGAWYLRSEAHARDGMPWHSVFFFSLAVAALGIGLAAGAAPQLPPEARWPALIGCGFLATLGWLSWRYKDPAEARPRRLGVVMYLLPFSVMLAFGLLQFYGPARPKATEAQIAVAMVEAKAQKEAEDKGLPASKQDATKAKAMEKEKSPAEKAALGEAQSRLRRAEQREDIEAERKLQTSGSYLEFVRFRAREFAGHASGEFGFAAILIGMFLLGYWFVRTGVMQRPAEHLPLFRKMALVGLPLGIGLGVVGSLISTTDVPGMERDPYQIAMSLLMIGNLPACLGYVSLLVLMLHSRGPFAKVLVLAPLGRMALTNYLMHSLVSGLYFYNYAGNHYGMGRAGQVGFVFTVIALQLVFSHLWLGYFRYGPMEWLWRAITYWQLPAFRRESTPALARGAAA